MIYLSAVERARAVPRDLGWHELEANRDWGERDLMNGLFPIIRRVRRPLLPADGGGGCQARGGPGRACRM